MTNRQRIFLTTILGLLFLTGCTTQTIERDSQIPWGERQEWENQAPGMPQGGF